MYKTESYKSGIVVSTVLNVLNKGLVFFNGLLVIYFFDVAITTDIYFHLSSTLLIGGAFVSSLNSSVLIPEYMRIKFTEDDGKAVDFINFFLYLYLAIALISIGLIAFNPSAFFAAVSGFATEELRDNEILLYLSLPLFGMICIISLLTDVLTSAKVFSFAMIAGIINGLCFAIFIYFFHKTLGLSSTLYALLLSYSLNIFILVRLLIRRAGWKFRRVTFIDTRKVWTNIWFAQVGNFSSTLTAYVPIYVLSGFNPGILTALTFSQQLATLPNSLLVSQFSAVSAIKFNELHSNKNWVELDMTFRKSVDFLHLILVPVSLFLFFFTKDIIEVIIGFTSLTPQVQGYVVLFTKYLALVLPFYVVNTFNARLFMAGSKIREAVWFQTIINSTLIIAIFVFVKFFGVIAYPITLAIVYFANFFVVYFMVAKYFSFVQYRLVAKNFFTIYFVNAIIALLIYLLYQQLHQFSPIVRLLIAFCAFAVLLLISYKFLSFDKLLNVTLEHFQKKKIESRVSVVS